MPTSDPEMLKIPAFMRKKGLARQAKSSQLLLTAYDREKAGELKKLEKKIAKKQKVFVSQMTALKKPRLKKKIKKAAPPSRVASKPMDAFDLPIVETFSPPPLDMFSPPMIEPAVPTVKRKSVGVTTHYYDRIHVGVIKLSSPLSVGDTIEIENDFGSFEQTVESLEINRSPVFTAKKGSEVGLKLIEKPKIGGKAYRVQS